MNRIDTPEIQDFEREHGELVRRLAAECTLFLKCSGAFPVAPCNVALYGNGARRTVKGGKGSGDVNARHVVSVEEGLENAGFTVTSKEWLAGFEREEQCVFNAFVQEVRAEAERTGTPPILVYYAKKEKPVAEYPVDRFSEGDVCLYVLSRDSGEGGDRSAGKGDYLLTDTEVRDILTLSRRYPKFCLVLNVAAPIDLTPVAEVGDILLLGQTGASVGDVCADILTGKSYPSGKLAATWAPIGEYPSTEGFGAWDDTEYREGVYVGYRYFDTFAKTPLYPFGFGLSYTQFALEGKGVSADERTVAVTVCVKNVGGTRGKETVQLYVSSPAEDAPLQELRAFRKTKELQPGESEMLVLSFPTAELAGYDEASASYVLSQGDHILRLGTHSRNTEPIAILRLEKSVSVIRCKNLSPRAKGLNEIVPPSRPKRALPEGLPVFALQPEKFPCEDRTGKLSPRDGEVYAKKGYTLHNVLSGDISLGAFTDDLSEEELIYLCVGEYTDEEGKASLIGNASKQVAGGAGDTCERLKERKIPGIVTADGPAGLRLNREYGLDGKGKLISSGMVPEDLRVFAPERFPEAEIPGKKYYQYCTAIPVGTSLAQSWNESLIEACGELVGKEMRRFGVHLWLAPGMNLQRSPLCGRNFEYYSEDPLVSGRCAAAMTRGVQKIRGCGVTVKHFCCNNQETNREHSNSVVGERALRELYLKGFEICIREAAPAAVMTSYNLVNGVHTANSTLLQQVLREEWGFDGFVMTDWYSTGLKPYQGKYGSAGSALCIKAGNDLIMPGYPKYAEELRKGVKEGAIGLSDLRSCAERILRFVLSCFQKEE